MRFRNLEVEAAKAGELVSGTTAASLEQAQAQDRISWTANETDRVVQRNSAMHRNLIRPWRRRTPGGTDENNRK